MIRTTPSVAAFKCRLCSGPTAAAFQVCAACERTHGTRVAAFLARSLAEPTYANACLLSLPPKVRERAARQLSVALLSSPTRATPAATSQSPLRPLHKTSGSAKPQSRQAS